jgi:hypothetical protein
VSYLPLNKRSTFAAALPLACWLALSAGCGRTEVPVPPAEGVVEATAEEVHQFCGSCHAYPPPDTFPRAAWRKEVEQGYNFFALPGRYKVDPHRPLKVPPLDRVVAYYENRAPEELPLLPKEKPAVPYPVRFGRSDYRIPGQPASPAISNVNLVHLWDEQKLDLLACEMRAGKVLAMRPYDKAPAWQVLGEVPNPAHAEVVDLDGDGLKDVLVANLGNFTPTDARVGSVVWLRGRPDGSFKPITLLKDVGRVADVQAGDFRGVGQLDLVVAVFGWQTTGEILYLENKTTDWDNPVFEPRVLDDRHGGIHVCVCDLNSDQKPDFVALISQEHETVVAFLNEGGGRFRKETIYAAPHPAFGSTGIQVVDLNGDGKLDVLLTNGDVLDQPYLLKPYHGIHWLENKGTYPFTPHQLTALYGVHRAVFV